MADNGYFVTDLVMGKIPVIINEHHVFLEVEKVGINLNTVIRLFVCQADNLYEQAMFKCGADMNARKKYIEKYLFVLLDDTRTFYPGSVQRWTAYNLPREYLTEGSPSSAVVLDPYRKANLKTFENAINKLSPELRKSAKKEIADLILNHYSETLEKMREMIIHKEGFYAEGKLWEDASFEFSEKLKKLFKKYRINIPVVAFKPPISKPVKPKGKGKTKPAQSRLKQARREVGGAPRRSMRQVNDQHGIPPGQAATATPEAKARYRAITNPESSPEGQKAADGREERAKARTEMRRKR